MPMRRWMRQPSIGIPASASARCHANTCAYTVSTSVPSRSKISASTRRSYHRRPPSAARRPSRGAPLEHHAEPDQEDEDAGEREPGEHAPRRRPWIEAARREVRHTDLPGAVALPDVDDRPATAVLLQPERDELRIG